MTNLEFIEVLIKEDKEVIELMKKMIAEYDNDDKFPSIMKLNEENLKCVEEQLAQLQQIKTDLEAWEVVKPNVVEENIITDREIKVIKVKCTVYPKGESNGKYEKLKKALERKDE